MTDAPAGGLARWSVSPAGTIISEENKNFFYANVVQTVIGYFTGRQQTLVAQSLQDVQRASNSQFMTIDFEGTAVISSDDLQYLKSMLQHLDSRVCMRMAPGRGSVLSVTINMAVGLEYLAASNNSNFGTTRHSSGSSRILYVLALLGLLLAVFGWFATGSQWKRALLQFLASGNGNSTAPGE
jgi:hypothetical protein